MEKTNLKYWAITGSVVLCLLVAFVIGVYYSPIDFLKLDKDVSLPPPPETPNVSQDFEAPQTKNDIVNQSPALFVSWINPKEISTLPVFGVNVRVRDAHFYELGQASLPAGLNGTNELSGDGSQKFNVYRIEYWNEEEMPFFSYDYLLGTKDQGGNNKYYLVEKNSDYSLSSYEDYIKKYPNENSLNRIYNQRVSVFSGGYALPLGFPKKISDKNGAVLDLLDYSPHEHFDVAGLTLAFTDEKAGNIYYKKGKTSNSSSVFDRGGFYAKAPDGTVRVYQISGPKFIGSPSEGKAGFSLNNGLVAKSIYYKWTDVGGCGSTNYASVVELPESDLVVIGKANFDNTPIFGLKSKQHEILTFVYNNHYNPYNEEKLAYEDFVKSVPVFFWRDTFGRLIKFESESFLPQAECGKPVIYLYPQKTEEINVRVYPKGGFSKTIPEYGKAQGEGWYVSATPDSLITDHKTKEIFPYLFWEGTGGIYETPKKGFVVEKESVELFLKDKLSLLGLNEKEQKDFMEFWLPKMQSAPYYFVTFLGNKEMENIAPLVVFPKPDTVIRVLMDFVPLEKKIKAEGFEIKTPKRNGFTVVEWGGVLR